LTTRISELCERPINTTHQLGVDPNYVEAIAFAWLAKQAIDGLPGNCKTATGAIKEVVLGGIYQA
jgi:anhydro-N-acetylmuramic acid kinase